MVMLDYRKCGKGGEPKVVLVEVISGPKIIPLAENFESFIKGLVEKSKFASKFRKSAYWSGGTPWEAVSIMLGHKDAETIKFCVEHLLERGVGIDPDDKGISLMAEVAYSPGYLEIIKLLVEKGADIDGVGYHGATAFLIACGTMDLEVIKYLHKRGANIHAVNKNKNALMHIRKRNDYCYYCPKKVNEANIIDYLIKIGIDVNAASKSGFTALMEHAKYGFLKAVQALVKHGANINALTKKGESALFFAIKYKHKEVENFLLEHGADESLACILGIRNKNKKDKFDYLSAMYGDSYFPEPLVDKVKALIVKVVEFLNKGVYTTEEVQAKFDAMTIGINKLQKKFEEKDSEIETMARESIAETVEEIIAHYKLKIDTETALRERDW
jgi:ankyrin repeat protein